MTTFPVSATGTVTSLVTAQKVRVAVLLKNLGPGKVEVTGPALLPAGPNSATLSVGEITLFVDSQVEVKAVADAGGVVNASTVELVSFQIVSTP